jgi:hypothetical protein
MRGMLAVGAMGVLVALPGPLYPQGAPVPADMDAVRFMEGCWRADQAGGFMYERYGPVTANLMLGATLFVRGDTAVSHELAEIVRLDDGTVRLTPYPNGQESADAFYLTEHDDAMATFEAPEHDYPRRIQYRRLGPERLQARIDGGAEDPEPRVWVMTRVPCTG